MANYYQKLLAISCGGLLCLNLGAAPSLADSQAGNVPIQGLPGRRLGGGTRNPDGHIGPMPLAALIPENNIGITTAESPCFLFYLPAADQTRAVEFVLYNETDDLVYEKTVLVEATSGIFRLDLAEVEDLAPLQLNANYHWYFSIIATDRAQDISVNGWTRRVDLLTWLQNQGLTADFLLRLEAANPTEKARLLYQEAYLWHDAAVLLEDLQQSNPSNQAVIEEWHNLLQVENLVEIGSGPMNQVSIVQSDARQ